MPDQYYCDLSTWRARWPLSRVVRYLFILAVGALIGAGPITRFTERTATSSAPARTNPSVHHLAPTVLRGPTVGNDFKNAMREVIRAELDGIEQRIDAMEASHATIAQLARTIEDESNTGVMNSHRPSEWGSAMANHAFVIERVKNSVESDSTLFTTEQ